MVTQAQLEKVREEAKATITLLLKQTTSAPPVDLKRLSQLCGIKRVQEGPINVDAMLAPYENGYRVLLKADQPKVRKRFSWAHELAHFLIEKPTPQGVSLRKHSSDKVERLCNTLAAEILMPRDMFKSYLEKFGFTLASVPLLADTFDTSIESTSIRFAELLPTPCLLIKWRSDNGNASMLRPAWQTRNRKPGSVVRNIPRNAWGKRFTFKGAAQAYSGHGLFETREELLVRTPKQGRNTVTGGMFRAESMSFGSGASRFVLSATYLDTWP